MEWFSTILRNMVRPLQWWVVIAHWEQGLRVRLGKTSKILKPGIHFRIPFIDRIYVQSIRLRTITFTGLNALTKDKKTATINAAISFSISDVQKLYNTLSTPELTLESKAAESITRYMSSIDSTNIDIDSIISDVKMSLDEDWGLTDISFSIIGFTVCETYRLISSDYRSGTGLWSLDDDSRERK